MASLNFKATVPVFDANVGVGHRYNQLAPFEDPAGLLEEMQRHGVARALIYHAMGENISCITGNEELLKWVDNNDAFTPQWIASSTADSIAQLQDLHADGRVQSVRLFNTEVMNVPFADWIFGDLLEWLSAENIPLWVSFADTPATELMDTLRRFADLTIVFVGSHYSHSLVVQPFLRHLPNAHMEVSRFENVDALQRLKQEFGSERFLYGSFYPRWAMGPALFYIHHIGLSEAELTAYCAGNLERILQGSGRHD